MHSLFFSLYPPPGALFTAYEKVIVSCKTENRDRRDIKDIIKMKSRDLVFLKHFRFLASRKLGRGRKLNPHPPSRLPVPSIFCP